MNTRQKITALKILRYGGEIDFERGRKAAVLELLGHGELAATYADDTAAWYQANMERDDIAVRLNFTERWLRGEEVNDPDLIQAEERLEALRPRFFKVQAEVRAIGDQLEAEIAPSALAAYDEAQVVA